MMKSTATIRLIRGALAAVLVALSSVPTRAQSATCPLVNEKPMLVVQMFFGLSVAGRAEVSARAWAAFLRRQIAARFPNGFTIYDAQGAWLDTATHTLIHEKSKVLLIAVDDTPEIYAKISDLSDFYRRTFRQQSVGVITSTGCAAF